jgi:hypothetical protein
MLDIRFSTAHENAVTAARLDDESTQIPAQARAQEVVESV